MSGQAQASRAIVGDAIELKWNAKDLESLKVVARDYCRSRRVVVQAGGCLGVFAKWLAGEFERVYTFEPAPELFSQLVANVPEANVVKLQAALGLEPGRFVRTVCELRGDDGKTVLHPGMTRTEPSGIIPTLKLDDLKLDCCDLIYLDIEGDELSALLGASETLRHFKPVVACEINRGGDYRGVGRDDIPRYLGSLGYRYAAQLRSDFVFVPEAGGQ